VLQLLTLEKLKQIGRSPSRIFFNATKEKFNEWIPSTRKSVEPFLNTDCTLFDLNYGQEIDFTN